VSEGPRHIVFVSGLSGSGRTTAMAALEDLSFYSVDNLPAQLVPQFLDLCAKATPPIDKVALAIDAREEPFLRRFPEVVRELRTHGGRVDGIFLDCSNDVLLNRYRETRRVHPLSPEGSVEEGIDRERRLLTEVSGMSNFQIDTSVLNVHQLKETVMQLVSGQARGTVVNVISFGFRHGIPQAAELLFDLRFLPNPYFVDELRPLDGRSAVIQQFLDDHGETGEFVERLQNFLNYLIPHYAAEGKTYLTVALGCTGGKHRSVALAERLGQHFRSGDLPTSVNHRDLGRE